MADVSKAAADWVALISDPARMVALGLLAAALKAGEVNQADVLRLLAMDDPPPAGVVDQARDLIKRPRNLDSSDLEIDEQPMCSDAAGGCWVSAWVWVDDAGEG